MKKKEVDVFEDWWFLNGGGIYQVVRDQAWSTLERLARELPRLAWNTQQQKIDKKDVRIMEFEEVCGNILSDLKTFKVTQCKDVKNDFLLEESILYINQLLRKV